MKIVFVCVIFFFMGFVSMNAQIPNTISKEDKIFGLSKFWMEVNYNFIYLDKFGKEKWDSVYKASIITIGETKNDLEYYRELQRICALLQDGHTNIYFPDGLRRKYFVPPAFFTRLIDDKVVVTEIGNDTLKINGLFVGTEILAVNGMEVMDYAAQYILPYTSASTIQDKEIRAFFYDFLLGPREETLLLKVKNVNGEIKNITVPRSVRWRNTSVSRPTIAYKLLPGNIGHLSLNSFNDETFNKLFDSIYLKAQTANALIIDLRNNGGGTSTYGFYVLQHLVHIPFVSTSWVTKQHIAKLKAGGDPDRLFGTAGRKYLPVNKMIYDNPVVWLTGPKTFSAAEDVSAIFDHIKRGIIIGTATAGSTGEPLWFDLPGGGKARVCTEKDTYPDGREFVGYGVKPGIEVKQTVAGFINNRDEVMGKAIDYLKTKIR
jgi:carboxyl-terminal processing protease